MIMPHCGWTVHCSFGGVHDVILFTGADRDLLTQCQALRYRVYHGDLGLDMPDLDHVAKVDVEDRDPHSDFAAVLDGRPATRGAVLGCIRMQPGERRPLYAELEFDLLGPAWSTERLVEGARFAVTAAERDGPVPLLLFQALRRYCRERAVGRVLSVAIVRGERGDRARAASLTRYFIDRTEVALERARPARGYELDPPTAEELASAGALRSHDASPMVRLLANRRTTLCSLPAYCHRFGTFNFLLTTRLA